MKMAHVTLSFILIRFCKCQLRLGAGKYKLMARVLNTDWRPVLSNTNWGQGARKQTPIEKNVETSLFTDYVSQVSV